MIILRIKSLLPAILSAVILVTTVLLSSVGKPIKQTAASEHKKNSAVSTTATDKSEQEMRGIWITYIELSMENEKDKSKTAFTNKFSQMAKNCKDMGFNTLIVQVRPFCDALYKSDYFPYSHILSGTQGKNPGYDALKIMCEICTEMDLKIQAWINPYRVRISQTPGAFSDNNPYIQNPELCIETESGIYLDPSNKDARELIENGIKELIDNYDIDGIQFDDYFYPTDIGDKDKAQYEEYLDSPGESKMDISTWRELNVNILISEIYMLVHSSGKNVVFGISPQGNLINNKKLSADVVSWCCTKGFVDYICPQIYFSLDNPSLSFEDALHDWCSLDLAPDVKLYAGLAGYKAGTDADEGTWLGADNILSTEYEIIKSNKKLSGFILYSYTSLNDKTAESEMTNLIKSLN